MTTAQLMKIFLGPFAVIFFLVFIFVVLVYVCQKIEDILTDFFCINDRLIKVLIQLCFWFYMLLVWVFYLHTIGVIKND